MIRQILFYLKRLYCIIQMISFRKINITSTYSVFFLIISCGIIYVIPIKLSIKIICCSILLIAYIAYIICPNNKYLQKCLKSSKDFWFAIISFRYSHDDITTIICKPSGLENIGNTCYMNSTMQMLASSNKIIHQLEDINANIGTPNRTLNILINLLQRLNKSDCCSKENTRKLNLLIDDINWTKVSQQDVVDLLSSIINSIQKESKNELSERGIQVILKCKMLHQYSGINIPNKIQDHLGLSLGLYGKYGDYPGVTIEDLIENHFSPCYIDEDVNKRNQIFFYGNSPDVLFLHIQANKWDSVKGQMIKPIYHIQYKHDLQLTLNIATDIDKIMSNVRVNYKLCAIVHHMGTISEGHYIAYRKCQNKWFLVNDEDIREVEFKCDVCPYILLYEKEECIKLVF